MPIPENKQLGSLNRMVQMLISLRVAKENNPSTEYSPMFCQMTMRQFLAELNGTLENETIVRFGLPELVDNRFIRAHALVPGNGLGLVTIRAYISNDMPMYTLQCFDAHDSMCAEYAFFDAVDPEDGLVAVLKKQYGDSILYGFNEVNNGKDAN